MTQPNNQQNEKNPVGRFMLAVGALLVHEKTKKILIVQRSSSQDFQPNEWEIVYGRLAQYENPEHGLRRELAEEIGKTDIMIHHVISVWHIYRGAEKAENELIGITFVCSTKTDRIFLSHEHQAYAWVTPHEAFERITVLGIRKDLELFLQAPNIPK